MRAAANKLGGKAVKVGALGERRLSGAKLTQRQMEGGWGGARGGPGEAPGTVMDHPAASFYHRFQADV